MIPATRQRHPLVALLAALLSFFAELPADEAPVPRPSAPPAEVTRRRVPLSVPAPSLSDARKQLLESTRNSSVTTIEWDKKPISTGVHLKVFRIMRFDTEQDWKAKNIFWDSLSTPVEKIAAVLDHPEDALRDGNLSRVVASASVHIIHSASFTKTWLLSTERGRYIVACKDAANPRLFFVGILMKQQQRGEDRFVEVTLDKDAQWGDSVARAIVKQIDDELSGEKGPVTDQLKGN